MRYIVKREEDKPEQLASEKTYHDLCKIISTHNKNLIQEKIYRDSYDTSDGKRSKVEDQLSIAYERKCAYCERLCKADIEHYRPKKGVQEDNTHEGYYWLCYEWTNLIPSCITCNREGAKHNKFPVLGPRVTHPPLLPNGKLNLDLCKASRSPLKDEKPYLLHPEVDHPEEYLEFEIDPNNEGIRIVGIDVLGRGNKTIEICQLNRLELKLDRVERIIDDFKDAIHSLFVQLSEKSIDNTEFMNQLKHHLTMLRTYSLNEKKTHTLLRKYIVSSPENFKKIVLPFLELKVRSIVYEAFCSI